MNPCDGKRQMCSTRQPSCEMIRFMYYRVVKIIRRRCWADVLHVSVSQPAWMVFISLLSANPFFTRRKIVFSDMIIPEVVKIPASFKLKMVYMCSLILPGIIKYPVYRLHFQKIFFIGRKKDLPSQKRITRGFWTRPASPLP